MHIISQSKSIDYAFNQGDESNNIQPKPDTPDIDLSTIIPKYLYHGTSSSYMDSIKQKGLVPSDEENHGTWCCSQPGVVCLTGDKQEAGEWGLVTASQTGVLLVLTIDTSQLDYSKFINDINSLEEDEDLTDLPEQYKGKNLEHLYTLLKFNNNGPIAYSGIIPPNAIIEYKIFEDYPGDINQSDENRNKLHEIGYGIRRLFWDKNNDIQIAINLLYKRVDNIIKSNNDFFLQNHIVGSIPNGQTAKKLILEHNDISLLVKINLGMNPNLSQSIADFIAYLQQFSNKYPFINQMIEVINQVINEGKTFRV